MNGYFYGFENSDDVFQQFQTSGDEVKDIDILFASYEQGDYEGSAFVLFSQNGKLYEVNGSHCSCYGLEGQWSPEETSVEEILYRMEHGKGYYWQYFPKNELKEVLIKISEIKTL